MRKPISEKRWPHDTAREWIHVRYFCPECGKRDMWQRDDDNEGDYYHANTAFCHSCGASMCCVGAPEEFAGTPGAQEARDLNQKLMLYATMHNCERVPCEFCDTLEAAAKILSAVGRNV